MSCEPSICKDVSRAENLRSAFGPRRVPPRKGSVSTRFLVGTSDKNHERWAASGREPLPGPVVRGVLWPCGNGKARPPTFTSPLRAAAGSQAQPKADDPPDQAEPEPPTDPPRPPAGAAPCAADARHRYRGSPSARTDGQPPPTRSGGAPAACTRTRTGPQRRRSRKFRLLVCRDGEVRRSVLRFREGGCPLYAPASVARCVRLGLPAHGGPGGVRAGCGPREAGQGRARGWQWLACSLESSGGFAADAALNTWAGPPVLRSDPVMPMITAMRSASLLAVLLAFVCVAAVGCGSNSSNSDAQHYPAEAISNFMASCQQSAQQGGRVTSEQAGDYAPA